MTTMIVRSARSTARFQRSTPAARTPRNGTTTPRRFAMRSTRVMALGSHTIGAISCVLTRSSLSKIHVKDTKTDLWRRRSGAVVAVGAGGLGRRLRGGALGARGRHAIALGLGAAGHVQRPLDPLGHAVADRLRVALGRRGRRRWGSGGGRLGRGRRRGSGRQPEDRLGDR